MARRIGERRAAGGGRHSKRASILSLPQRNAIQRKQGRVLGLQVFRQRILLVAQADEGGGSFNGMRWKLRLQFALASWRRRCAATIAAMVSATDTPALAGELNFAMSAALQRTLHPDEASDVPLCTSLPISVT
jgi:hypothetical protein